MVFGSRRAAFRGSVVSLFLLLILFLIALGVLVKQGRFNRQKFSINPEIATAPAAAAGLDISQFTPAGFKPMGPGETYNSNNLYEKIDGKAELYLPAGFVLLNCRRFVDDSSTDRWFEVYVYDMNTPDGAFAVYSAQQRENADKLNLGRFAYETTDAIFFTQDKYYVEILASDESDKIKVAMTRLGRSFVNDFSSAPRNIAEMKILSSPKLNKVSVKLIAANAFGSSELKNIFVAECMIDGREVELFLSRQPSRKKAKSLAQDYYDFLINNGAVPKQTNCQIDNCRVVNFYGTIEIVFSVNNFFAGVHGAENIDSAIKAVKILAEELNGLQNNEQ